MKNIIIFFSILICTFSNNPCIAMERDYKMVMLKRIGISHPLEHKEIPFKIAVVDAGEVYKHPSIHNVEPIKDAPLSPSVELQQSPLYGFGMCSIIHQLLPTLQISYFKFDTYSSNDFGDNFDAQLSCVTDLINDSIDCALNDPNVKIINCSTEKNI